MRLRSVWVYIDCLDETLSTAEHGGGVSSDFEGNVNDANLPVSRRDCLFW